MTGYKLRLMITACKNRLNEGKTWNEISEIYPKLTAEELSQIKSTIESEP